MGEKLSSSEQPSMQQLLASLRNGSRGVRSKGLTSAKSNVEKEECLRKKEKTQKDHFNDENLQKIIKIAS